MNSLFLTKRVLKSQLPPDNHLWRLPRLSMTVKSWLLNPRKTKWKAAWCGGTNSPFCIQATRQPVELEQVQSFTSVHLFKAGLAEAGQGQSPAGKASYSRSLSPRLPLAGSHSVFSAQQCCFQDVLLKHPHVSLSQLDPELFPGRV